MNHTPEQHIKKSWLELPHLVEEFVQTVAGAMDIPTLVVRRAICKQLKLESYDSLAKICRMTAEVRPIIDEAYTEGKFEYAGQSKHLVGLAAHVLKTWSQFGSEMYALQRIDESAVTEAGSLPITKLAHMADLSEDITVKRKIADSKDVREHLAWSVIEEFRLSFAEWRLNLIQGYTLVRYGTPADEYVVASATEFVKHLALPKTAHDVEEYAYRVLAARGYFGVDLLCFNARPSNQSNFYPGMDPTEHEQWIEGLNERMMIGISNGQHTRKIADLKASMKWVEPQDVSGSFGAGPTMSQVFAYLPEEAYIDLVESDDVIDPRIEFCPFSTIYIESEDGLAFALRCIPCISADIFVVSKQDAIQLGNPELAGWLAVQWSSTNV